MKKSYIKYILCLLFGIFFFGNGIAFGACSEDMSAGFRDDLPGNGQQNGQCWSNATQGDDWYNNQNPLSDGADLFLKMIDKTWVECDSQNVASIQRAMQSIGGMCSTCIDGRAGNHMRSAIGNCASIMCSGELQVPTLIGGNLMCSNGYNLKNGCCEKISCDSIDENFIDVMENGACQDGYEIVTEGGGENICCKEKEEYEPKPTFIYKGDWDGDTIYNVEIDFSQNDKEYFLRWGNDSLITINSGHIINNMRKDSNGMRVLFDVDTNGSDSVTVNVGPGLIVFTGEVLSLPGTEIFTKDTNICEYQPGEYSDCSQYGGYFFYNFDTQCCEETESCQIQKNSDGQCDGSLILDTAGECCIACANPVDNSGNCQSGYTLQGSCCFANNMCGDTGYNVGGQCYACGTGQKPNENHTKCVCDPNVKCCGIKLNTTVPFIGDCIESGPTSRDGSTQVNEVTAFPVLIQGLMKIILSLTLIFSFLMIIVAGFLMTSSAFKDSLYSKGKDIIKKVIISLILLGCSGLILSLINPSFFGG